MDRPLVLTGEVSALFAERFAIEFARLQVDACGCAADDLADVPNLMRQAYVNVAGQRIQDTLRLRPLRGDAT